MSAVFLESGEIAELTGRKIKSKQIETLRQMGMRFWVNAAGKPVVPRSAIDGIKELPKKKTWDLPE